MNKINFVRIIVDHLRTFSKEVEISRHDQPETKTEWNKADLFIFFGLPSVLSAWAIYCKFTFSSDALASLDTIFSVFSALLLSALIGLFALRRTSDYDDLGDIERSIRARDARKFNDFLGSLSANLSYLILISVLALLFSFLRDIGFFLDFIFDGALVFLTLNFFLTLFMVLKRLYLAFDPTQR